MLEDHVEKSHQDIDNFHQRVARLRSHEKRAFSFSHHEKTVNNPAVIAAGKKAVETTKRKRTVDGPSLAEARSRRKQLETLNARIISLPSRCDQPERRFSHTRGRSRSIRITVLNIHAVNACSLCSLSVDRVQPARRLIYNYEINMKRTN